ncbi:MAG: glucuronate isomerase [Planctomycetaceae bacterium]|nr:glucuronate isomerase [Planctomycetaceae bacterium]
MSLELRKRLYDELNALVLIDPHTHINPSDPASHTLADILGYHYYTELAHSAGMPKDRIEEPGIGSREKVRRLIEHLGPIDNTIQYSWLIEMVQTLFGLETDSVTPHNWEGLYDAAQTLMEQPDWPQQVLAKSKLEAVFLTNDFDDSLDGFDTDVYIPCLRTDDLVFHLAKTEVRERLTRCTGTTPSDAQALRRAIGALFTFFKSRGARACAISLPPDFAPHKVSLARANTALAAINAEGTFAADSHKKALGHFVLWTLAEMCAEYRLPFDLMIGVNRGVYEAGVHQGRDLYDSRVSLIQYKDLFNAFPQVTFPISVLASVTNQELTSYAWIFPNVVTHGHWWYSNTPTFIEHDLAARLEAVPRTKQIAYYSDMYKLEFALPKLGMFKRILAKVLAERFVIDRKWSEEKAVELGTQVLRGNTERIFRWGEDLRGEMPVEAVKKTYFIEPTSPSVAAATGSVLTPQDQIRIEPPKEEAVFQPSDEVELGAVDLTEPASADDAGMAVVEPTAEESAATLDLGEEQLELLDEPAKASEGDSGVLSLEEPASSDARETFSFRQTEPIGKGASEEQPDELPGDEVPGDEQLIELLPDEQKTEEQSEEPGPDNWDFLNTRKK